MTVFPTCALIFNINEDFDALYVTRNQISPYGATVEISLPGSEKIAYSPQINRIQATQVIFCKGV